MKQKKIIPYMSPNEEAKSKRKFAADRGDGGKLPKTRKALVSEPPTPSKSQNSTARRKTVLLLHKKIQKLCLLKDLVHSGRMSDKRAHQILQNSDLDVEEVPTQQQQHEKENPDGSSQAVTSATKTVSEGNKEASNKSKKQQVSKPLNPYAPDCERECEDVGMTLSNQELVPGMYRFAPDHILCVEKIPLDVGNGKTVSYDGWSIRRCPQGEDPLADVVDKNGQTRKPFNFSGRLISLPELHRAFRKMRHESFMGRTLCRKAAKRLKPGKFGVTDMYALRKPVYSKKMYSFSNFMCFIQEVSYKDKKENIQTYTCFTLTKPKSEAAKRSPKNKSDTDFFDMSVSINHLAAAEIAASILMERNGMKPLPLDLKRKKQPKESVDNRGGKRQQVDRPRRSARTRRRDEGAAPSSDEEDADGKESEDVDMDSEGEEDDFVSSDSEVEHSDWDADEVEAKEGDSESDSGDDDDVEEMDEEDDPESEDDGDERDEQAPIRGSAPIDDDDGDNNEIEGGKGGNNGQEREDEEEEVISEGSDNAVKFFKGKKDASRSTKKRVSSKKEEPRKIKKAVRRTSGKK